MSYDLIIFFLKLFTKTIRFAQNVLKHLFYNKLNIFSIYLFLFEVLNSLKPLHVNIIQLIILCFIIKIILFVESIIILYKKK